MKKKVRMSRKRMRKEEIIERRGRSGRKTGFCQLLPPSASILIAGFEVRKVQRVATLTSPGIQNSTN